MSSGTECGDLPLSALLSQALVAFTIEFDNEAERRLPHRTTEAATGARGPWLVSMAMWLNSIRYLDEAGVAVRELERLARTPTNLDGLRRWGYVTLDGAGRGGRARRVGPKAVVRLTEAGHRAHGTWAPLGAEIEARWETRFGAELVYDVRAQLEAVVAELAPGLPDCMPILGYGLSTFGRTTAGDGDPAEALPVPALLARLLVAFALEFEERGSLSLAIVADVLRVLDRDGTAVGELPGLSGVSKEAIAMAAGFLGKLQLAKLSPAPGAKRRVALALTAQGERTLAEHVELLASVEQGWRARLGGDAVDRLRGALERLGPGLLDGVRPYPDGWRAARPPIETLPQFPAVLHRGGFPDGS